MDVIDEVVGSARAGRAFLRRIHEAGSWGLRFPAFEGIGFHVIRQGSGWLVRAAGEPVAVRAGDVVLAPHGAEHGLSHVPRAIGDLPAWVPDTRPPGPAPADIDFVCGAYHLDHGQVHLYLRRLPSVIVVSPDYERYPVLRSLLDLLDEDVTRRRPGTEVARPALVDLLLVHVLRLWQQGQDTTGWPAVGDATIDAALQEIHDNPQTPWTVARLSELAGLSRTVFTRRFTASVGKPPMTYLISWRLTRSARLLRETEAPLAAIARQIGYSSEFAFASAFRREFGISPGRFRNSRVRPGEMSAQARTLGRRDLG